MKKYLRISAAALAALTALQAGSAFAAEKLPFQELPDDVSYLEVNPLNPTANLITGAWMEKVKVDDEETIEMYDYLPATSQICEKAIMILLDSGVKAEDFILSSGWKAIADQNNVSILMIENAEGWKNDAKALKKLDKAYAASKLRHYYDLAWDLMDLVAYGEGATVAMQYTMAYPDNFAAVLLFGGDPVTEEYMAEMKQKPSKEPGLTVDRISCPVWRFADELTPELTAEIEYWKDANNNSDTVFANEYADYVYLPSYVYHSEGIDNANIAQTRLTVGKNVDGTGEELLQNIYDEYLWVYARHRGTGAQNLRYYVNPEDYGMTKYTTELDGIARYWYVYVPEQLKGSEEKVPLVVAMAGRGGSPSTFASLTDWPQIASDRGFICAFPMASYGRQLKNGVGNISMWNKADDVAFIRHVVEDVKAHYPIDEGRVYASGQSMGSMMSTRLSVTLPDVFTATGSTCAPLPQDSLESSYYNEEYDCPVFVIFGEKDATIGSYKASENANVQKMIDYYTNRYELDTIDTASKYRAGKFSHYLFYNKDGVPMFRYSVVDNKPHANVPSESYLLYDEFFAKFYRDADGKIHYEDDANVLDIH